MSGADGSRTRVLVADADAPRRAAVRQGLGHDFAVAETASAEETLRWLEDQAPGLTVMDHRLPGAGGAALVARIRELHPAELVVLLMPDLSADMCRAAMRAGAYDCIERGDRLPEEVRSTCEAAAARLDEADRTRRAGDEQARGAVRRHEREAAGRLVGTASLVAWGAADVAARERMLRDYLRAAEPGASDADRSRILRDLAREAADFEQPGEVLMALHVHALTSRGHGSDEALDRAREGLVRILSQVADLRMPPQAAAEPGGPTEPSVGDRSWFRWRVGERTEEWCLVIDGRPAARLTCDPAGARGWIAPHGGRLEQVALPPVPAGLREAERRLDVPSVLAVQTASTKA